jgi:hypothetical protein
MDILPRQWVELTSMYQEIRSGTEPEACQLADSMAFRPWRGFNKSPFFASGPVQKIGTLIEEYLY